MKVKKSGIIIFSILAVAVAVLLLTCPGREAHKDAIAEEVNAQLLGELGLKTDDTTPMTGSFKHTNRLLIDPFLKNDLIVTSYGLFSSSYIIDNGKKVKFGFGILGKVHIKDPKSIMSRIPVLKEPKPVACAVPATDIH